MLHSLLPRSLLFPSSLESLIFTSTSSHHSQPLPSNTPRQDKPAKTPRTMTGKDEMGIPLLHVSTNFRCPKMSREQNQTKFYSRYTQTYSFYSVLYKQNYKF